MRLQFGMLFFSFSSLGAQIVNYPLHKDGIETNEPSIAIDPNHPNIQILGSNTSYFFTSEDGGILWNPVFLKPKEGFYGDPVVYINRKGDYYVCHLSKNPFKKWPDQFDRIVFEKSTNSGKTFESVGIGLNGAKMQDKPWFYVDEGKKSKFRDCIYVAWTEFDKYGSRLPEDSSRIRFSASSDGGSSFSEAITVSDSCGDAADEDNTLEGATMATGIHGELYLVWAGKGKIWLDVSTDGGKSWGKDKAIAEQRGSWNTEDILGLMRSNSMPFITSDAKGCLYVVFGDNRNGDQDVYYLYSENKGKSFTSPIRLHNDKVGNGKDQFMPAICYDQKKKNVYAAWYDRRNSEYNGYTDVYIAQLHGKKPGNSVRVNAESFCVPSPKIFFGDYLGVAAAKDEIRIAYALYDSEKDIVTVHIAGLQAKALKAQNITQPFLQIDQLKDTGLVYIHFNLPGYKSCTLEMLRGGQMIYKQLFNPLVSADNEIQIPLQKLPAGVYKVILSFKGKKIERDFYIERM